MFDLDGAQNDGTIDSFMIDIPASTRPGSPDTASYSGTHHVATIELTYEVICLEGFSGDTCDVDHCFGVTCNNRGTCDDGDCECDDQYIGDRCEMMNPCFGVTCNNRGTCDDGDCECNDRYIGDRCERVNPCFGVTCNNRGTCVDGDCECNDRYIGDRCERVNPCFGETCNNQGKCVDGDCECDDRYIGDTCKMENPCFGIDCGNGSCYHQMPIVGAFRCECDHGYSGTFCDTAPTLGMCAEAPPLFPRLPLPPEGEGKEKEPIAYIHRDKSK